MMLSTHGPDSGKDCGLYGINDILCQAPTIGCAEGDYQKLASTALNWINIP
jgi:hypothetical protein